MSSKANPGGLAFFALLIIWLVQRLIAIASSPFYGFLGESTGERIKRRLPLTTALDKRGGSEVTKVLPQIEVDIVLIKKEILEAIIQHAREDVPLECCGLLMGQGNLISHLRRMKNALQSPISYSMEPRALLRFFKELRSLQLIHLGIYHSHPTSEAYPSSVDVEQAYYPDCTYFIASLRNPRSPSVRAFSILDRTVQEKEIQVID